MHFVYKLQYRFHFFLFPTTLGRPMKTQKFNYWNAGSSPKDPAGTKTSNFLWSVEYLDINPPLQMFVHQNRWCLL